MLRPLLQQLTLKGTPLRFECPPLDVPPLSSLLGHWQTYLKTTGTIGGIDLGRPADIHEQVVQFMRLVGRTANSATPHAVVSKCREHFSYFADKCGDYGTDLSTWDNGVTFAKPSPDAQRVISDVVRESIHHLLNFAHEQMPELGDRSPVTFIASQDDSRNPRGCYSYGSDFALVETHYGAHLMVDLHDLSLTPGIVKTGWWEPWIDILLRSTLQPDMTYVNAGANIGYHTNLGAQLVGGNGQVFSFEGNPHAYSLLKKSVYINGFSDRTALFSAAVSDQPGQMEFYYVREMMGGGGLHAPSATRPGHRGHPLREQFSYEASDFTTVSVPVVTIDDAVGAETQTIDYLHMDIEGSEGPALLGAMGLILRSPRLQMIIEWSYRAMQPTAQEKARKAIGLLADQQFKAYVITPPRGNVYVEPPDLQRVEFADALNLEHCDLYLTKD